MTDVKARFKLFESFTLYIYVLYNSTLPSHRWQKIKLNKIFISPWCSTVDWLFYIYGIELAGWCYRWVMKHEVEIFNIRMSWEACRWVGKQVGKTGRKRGQTCLCCRRTVRAVIESWLSLPYHTPPPHPRHHPPPSSPSPLLPPTFPLGNWRTFLKVYSNLGEKGWSW